MCCFCEQNLGGKKQIWSWEDFFSSFGLQRLFPKIQQLFSCLSFALIPRSYDTVTVMGFYFSSFVNCKETLSGKYVNYKFYMFQLSKHDFLCHCCFLMLPHQHVPLTQKILPQCLQILPYFLTLHNILFHKWSITILKQAKLDPKILLP